MSHAAAAAAAWDRLRAAGIVAGEPPPLARAPAPWYVRAMLGVAGWIAALFAFGFVAAGLALVLRSPESAIVSGIIVLAGVWALFRFGGENDFAAQFGLAASFAGQAMVVYGVFSEGKNATADWASVAVLEGLLVWLVPNAVHRVWSAFAAALVTAVLLSTLGGYFLSAGILAAAVAFVWLHEIEWARASSLVRPMGFGFTLALLVVQGSVFGHHHLRGWIHGMSIDAMPAWVGPLAAGIVLVSVVAVLVTRVADTPAAAGGLPLLAAGAIAIASFWSPGLATGLTIVLLGFANASATLVGVGIAALVGYLSSYYYLQEATLLVKSITMAIAGAVLLAARMLMAVRFPPPGDADA